MSSEPVSRLSLSQRMPKWVILLHAGRGRPGGAGQVGCLVGGRGLTKVTSPCLFFHSCQLIVAKKQVSSLKVFFLAFLHVVFVDPYFRVVSALDRSVAVHVLVQVLLGVVVGGEDIERVAVDSDLASNGQVSWRDERVVFVDVLVLVLVQELALDDARVLLRWFVDAQAAVSQVVRDDESAVDVLGHARVEFCCKAQHFARVVHRLEEVALGLLGHQAVHLALRVLLVSEAIVGRDLTGSRLGRCCERHTAQSEIVAEPLSVELLGEGVDSLDLVNFTVGEDVSCGRDFVASQVVVANEVLAWLVHVHSVRQLLAAEKHGETITAIVGLVAFANLKRVVGEVVVHDVRQIVAYGEEAEHLTVMVQELLLGGQLSTAERLLQEFQKFGILLHLNGLLARLEGIRRCLLGRRQVTSLLLHTDKAFESY